jgi:hypothetical protein
MASSPFVQIPIEIPSYVITDDGEYEGESKFGVFCWMNHPNNNAEEIMASLRKSWNGEDLASLEYYGMISICTDENQYNVKILPRDKGIQISNPHDIHIYVTDVDMFFLNLGYDTIKFGEKILKDELLTFD